MRVWLGFSANWLTKAGCESFWAGRVGETHVSALCQFVGQSQPAVSHHLTLLRMAGLVASRREGKFNFYFLDGDGFANLLDEVFAAAGRNGRRISTTLR